MQTLNFNSNNFSFLSKEVKDAMNLANKTYINHRPDSFGTDTKVHVEIEEARALIAESLVLNPTEVFFSNGNIDSDFEFISTAILFLDVKHIISSVFENKQKLSFLKNLKANGRIKLHYIETNAFGEINLPNLKNKVKSLNGNSLLSLSHANAFTGMLLPIKEISSICKMLGSFFHLNMNLSIGRYNINFQNIKPDFISFDSTLLNGPLGIGIKIICNKIGIDNKTYRSICNHTEALENNNLILITGFLNAYSKAVKHIEENQKRSKFLKDYFTIQLKKLSIYPIHTELKKEALINLVAFFVNTKEYGNYICEKFDLAGIYIEKANFPLIIEKYNTCEFINVAIHEEILESDIDRFVKILVR